MTSPEPINGEHPIAHHLIRSARIVADDGEESVAATVYCPLQERSTTVAECESCRRFHALHFDATARTTSVVCHAGPATPGEERADPLHGVGGPLDPETPIADIMTRDVLCVRPEVTVDELAALLVGHEISGVPVVDAEGRPVGMVSRADVLRAAQERGDTEESQRVTLQPDDIAPLDIEQGFHVYEPIKTTARDIMTPVVLQVHESASIRQAASLMAYEGVHRLAVTSDDGKVVGILSSLDVLRWFGRSCGYLIPVPARKRS
ncbi:CBS domain-containing protein [Sorangium sp. So ce1099]|uniref:CBS domain-containing protein n=1 Tax=Sorangium sp. So ce1099 TaxID=3133331 RepID=UPI003F5E51DD